VTQALGPANRHGVDVRRTFRYARAIARQFRITWVALLVAVAVGTTMIALTPLPSLNGARPGVGAAMYTAWMAMLAEQVFTVTGVWHLELMQALYPLVGAVVLGEGVVRFALLMSSRRAGEMEWMRVEASVLKDHVIVCGMGHLGVRVVEELVVRGVTVVVIEQDSNAKHLTRARQLNVVHFVRDIRDDQALLDAGIARARALIVATSDDLANIEVALDARRMNPTIRIVMRQFDQELAGKIARSASIDAAFSSAALAAPVVVERALAADSASAVSGSDPKFVQRFVRVGDTEAVDGRSVAEVEAAFRVRILYVRGSSGDVALAEAGLRLTAGTEMFVYGAVVDVGRLAG